MLKVLLATDSNRLRDEVDAALSGAETTVSRVRSGPEVAEAVRSLRPDLVVLDMQIGNMGGIAVCHDLRHEVAADRLDPVKIMLLLDRADDRFLARTADADGWLVKPLDALRLQQAVAALLAGEPYAEDRAAIGFSATAR